MNRNNDIFYLIFIVDCWDGPNDEPMIYHGHTFTSKITFKSVIETINEHTFNVLKANTSTMKKWPYKRYDYLEGDDI